MLLKDCNLHDRVNVWVNPQYQNTIRTGPTYPNYIPLPTTIGGHYDRNTLLVWKPGENTVNGAGHLGNILLGNDPHAIEIVAKSYGYDRGYWTLDTYQCEPIDAGVQAVATSAIKTEVPISCKICGIFAQYAVPNQSDGVSFICYSCRR